MSTPESLEKIRQKYPARLPRSRAIRLYCKMNCCAGDTASWRDCEQKGCFLWAFRMGREVLGNQTSFKKSTQKHRQSSIKLAKNSILQTTSDPSIPSHTSGDSQTKLMEVEDG